MDMRGRQCSGEEGDHTVDGHSCWKLGASTYDVVKGMMYLPESLCRVGRAMMCW